LSLLRWHCLLLRRCLLQEHLLRLLHHLLLLLLLSLLHDVHLPPIWKVCYLHPLLHRGLLGLH